MADGGFAESTIDATVWLILNHPGRLAEWFDCHEPGLEKIARGRIKGKITTGAFGPTAKEEKST